MPTYFIGYKAPIKNFDECISKPYILIPLEQRHLTLLYFGFLRGHEIKSLINMTRSIRVERIEVLFSSLTVFPSLRKPRYLAVIPDDNDRKKLSEKRRYIENMFYHFIKDKYEMFKPHVSIAYTREKSSLKLEKKVTKLIKNCKGIREFMVFDKMYIFKAEKGNISIIYDIA